MTMTNIENRLSSEELNARIAYLAEFMTAERFATLERTVERRTDYMTLVAENMFHPQNASALVRHCEAFGISQLNTIETLCPFNPNINIVRGTDKWVDIRQHQSTAECIATLKREGYRIVATTPHRESCTPETFDVAAGRFAIVLGTEKSGISDEVFDAADAYLRIPMEGMVESLNVSACAAIITYMLSQRIRQSLDVWQLPYDEQRQLLYRWCCRSVVDAERVLERGGFAIDEK